jgi:hypothetical protein
MPSLTDPRALLDALNSGDALADFAPEAVEAARTLARDAAVANPAAVDALPEPLTLAVLEAAVLAGSPVLPEALIVSGRKGVAKAAKRAAYRLRSRGVAVAEPSRPASTPPPTVATEPSPEALPALLSPTTGTGEFALVLGRLLKGGGIETVQALISDELGVRELALAEVSRGTFRKMLRDSREGRYAAEVPYPLGTALLAEAAGRNLRTRSPFPHGLDTALRHHGLQPAEEPSLPPPEPEDERLAITEGATLHEAPEILQWLPPEGELRRVVGKMDEVVVSPLELSQAQREAQLLQAVRALAHEFFTPAMRQHYARRLWRMAEFLERTERAHLAQVARAEARRLFHGAVEPPSRFAERLYEKVLQLARMPRAPGPAAPARAPETTKAAEASPAPATSERRSPGGLILP